jgi:hypothetical protein
MVMKIKVEIPDRSVTRDKLEYPTEDVSFSYLASINKVLYVAQNWWGYNVVTRDVFADKVVFAVVQVNRYSGAIGRNQDYVNTYYSEYNPPASTADHYINRLKAGTTATLATEAIDINTEGRGLMISCSGSVIKSLRFNLPIATDPLALPTPNATISATDTTFASGHFGFKQLHIDYPHGGSESGSVWLKAPVTPLPPALAVLEVEIEGSGAPEDPYRPSLSQNLVEIQSLTGLPEFLYREAKKYEILKNKGFTDEEMRLLLGSIPQYQVDLNSVTWGAFEFSEKSPTNIIIITGDNPYQQGAIHKQTELAKNKNLKVLSPPQNYGEAVAQFNQHRRDYPWLAGKDSYAYQVLGLEELDLFQNVDFYFGELVEHRTHYDQLKRVPDWELWRRLEVLEERLSKVEVLTEERDKHLEKLKTIKRLGW